jgi:hypothetical protein
MTRLSLSSLTDKDRVAGEQFQNDFSRVELGAMRGIAIQWFIDEIRD